MRRERIMSLHRQHFGSPPPGRLLFRRGADPAGYFRDPLDRPEVLLPIAEVEQRWGEPKPCSASPKDLPLEEWAALMWLMGTDEDALVPFTIEVEAPSGTAWTADITTFRAVRAEVNE